MGTMKSVMKVATIRPPITARLSGAFCSPPSPSPNAMGIMAIPVNVRALELNVHQCREAEVENLRDHIRGTEREGGPGECTRQALAQLPDIVNRGMVIFPE